MGAVSFPQNSFVLHLTDELGLSRELQQEESSSCGF